MVQSLSSLKKERKKCSLCLTRVEQRQIWRPLEFGPVTFHIWVSCSNYWPMETCVKTRFTSDRQPAYSGEQQSGEYRVCDKQWKMEHCNFRAWWINVKQRSESPLGSRRPYVINLLRKQICSFPTFVTFHLSHQFTNRFKINTTTTHVPSWWCIYLQQQVMLAVSIV